MPSKQPKRDRGVTPICRAPEPELSDDEVLGSLIDEASERDLAALLHEFPRDPAFLLAIYEQFLQRGLTWSPTLRTQLADALARCRLREEADIVRDL